MARRETNLLQDAFTIFMKQPWWVPLVAIAAVGLLCNVLIANIMHAVYPKYAWDGFFQIIGNIFMSVFALAGIASWIWKGILALQGKPSPYEMSQKIAHRVGEITLEDLRAMSWSDFERVTGEAYKANGYVVVARGGAQADGGVDLIVLRENQRTLVQCKRWRDWRVGVKIVREVYGMLMHEGAAAAHIVTCGTFTQDAQTFAAGKPIELIDGDRLLAMLRTAPARPATPPMHVIPSPVQSTPPPAPVISEAPVVPVETPELAADTPTCPRCGAAMVLRTARKGANAGGQFWGCSQYPDCRAVVDVAP